MTFTFEPRGPERAVSEITAEAPERAFDSFFDFALSLLAGWSFAVAVACRFACLEAPSAVASATGNTPSAAMATTLSKRAGDRRT